MSPINRFDLPFLSISGFIDCNYGFSLAGNMPFFIKKGFEGVIPAGTPYMQIIPIKNIESIIKSISFLNNRYSFDLKLDIYGYGPTKYINTLKLMVNKSNLNNNIFFKGAIFTRYLFIKQKVTSNNSSVNIHDTYMIYQLSR